MPRGVRRGLPDFLGISVHRTSAADSEGHDELLPASEFCVWCGRLSSQPRAANCCAAAPLDAPDVTGANAVPPSALRVSLR